MPHMLAPGTIAYRDVPALSHGRIETTFVIEDELRGVFERASMMDQAYGEDLPDKTKMYPKGLIEGFHAVSLIDALTRPYLRFDPTDSISWNYGLDRVRFVRPLTSGEPLRFVAEVGDVREKETGYIVPLDCRVGLGEANGDVSLVAEWLLFVAPR